MKGYCCENDKLYDVICQTPELLCVIARFGIGCGFGDRTIRQICQEKALDCITVLAVLNFHTKAVRFYDPEVNLSIECLLGYLQNSHKYYLDYLFPTIRKKLIEAVGSLTDNELAFMILKFFDTPHHGGKVKDIEGIEFLKSNSHIYDYFFSFKIGYVINDCISDSASVGYFIA